MASFQVIIVGGGIGGLTLANCLQHAGIDFLLLEGREEIGLHVGAGVGIDPNGDRILDQLGVRSDLEAELVPNRCFIFRDIRGKFMYERDTPTLVMQRTGYFPWIYDRRCVLESLYNRIWDKERVIVKKRVQKIVHENSRLVVTCADNSTYTGDVVVGSDGVNSIVRNEMWRLSDLEEPGGIPATDKKYLTAEYRGLYGISDPIEGLDPGTITMVVGVDELCYWMVGKHGRIYWCLVERLATKLHFPNIPKYTNAEAIAYAEERLNKILLSDTAQVTFGDLWENRQVYALVTVEEGNLGVWTAGNIVCIGDIVHKMTPESGQGANQAIETAASLANHLKRMLDSCSEEAPTSMRIEKCLRDFQTHRQPRAREAVRQTNMNVRVLSLQTPLLKFMIENVAPLLGDIQANQVSDRHIGAERVEFLPLPARSFSGTMRFNYTQGITMYESRRQALFALPLLAIALFSLPDRKSAMPLFQILDTPVYLIWMLEGSRSVNYLKPIQWTLLFGLLAHKYGIMLSGNVWFFVHYVLSPVEVYAAFDQRLLQMNYARAILPSIVLTALLPTLLIISKPEDPMAIDLLSLWSWLPILLTLCQRLFAAFVKDTTPHDRLYNVKADLPVIRRTTVVTGIISLSSFQYLSYSLNNQGFSLLALVKNATPKDPQFLGLPLGGVIWVMLLFGDLKSARMIEHHWAGMLICFIVSMMIMGPGATLLAGWALREEVLASRRHWAASSH